MGWPLVAAAPEIVANGLQQALQMLQKCRFCKGFIGFPEMFEHHSRV
jgi:hypothetical protein